MGSEVAADSVYAKARCQNVDNEPKFRLEKERKATPTHGSASDSRLEGREAL
jgi:hypothetical protein